MSKKHKKHGFTLIELMAVIAGIMMVITLGAVVTCVVVVNRHTTRTMEVAP